jgi:hypothetical protein
VSKSRRRPNTENWQLIERTCRKISRRGWRGVAAELLGVERHDLRDRYDRDDLTGPELDFLHAALKRGIEKHLQTAEEAIMHIARAAAVVRETQANRLAKLRRDAEAAERAGEHDHVAEFERSFFADLLEAA